MYTCIHIQHYVCRCPGAAGPQDIHKQSVQQQIKTTGCQYLGQRGIVGQIDILGTGKLAYISTHQMKDILFDIDLKSL